MWRSVDFAQSLAIAAQTQLEWGQRMQLALALAFVCGAYLKLVVRRFTPSYWSLLLVAPVVALNIWLPSIFSAHTELCSRIVFLFLLMWLASFKAIGLCINRGPLVGTWTIGQTIMLYVAPIYPSAETNGVKKGRLTDNHTTRHAVLSFLSNTTTLVALAYVIATFNLPTLVKYYLYGLGLYGFITFMMDGPAAVLIALLDMQVVPPFDKPWLMNSLADFWGRRWNNTTSLMLRALVYDPIVEGSIMHNSTPPTAAPAAANQPSKQQHHQQQQQQAAPGKIPMWRRLLGMCATFTVSGIMHEFILYGVAGEGEYYAGFWFTFFFIQAPLLMAEGLVLKRLKAVGLKVPHYVGTVYATAFVMMTAYLFWFPPLESYTDIATRVVNGVNGNVSSLMQWGKDMAQQMGLDCHPAAALSALLAPTASAV